MPVLAGEILDIARKALLNDPAGAIYPDEAMYPVIDKAYKELQSKLTSLGIPATKEVTALITVAAGTTSMGEGSGLPLDFISPVWLGERDVGSNAHYAEMKEMTWEPSLSRTTSLIYWTWREEQIKFVGATRDRDVMIRYLKSLGKIVDANSTILILNSEQWLAQRVAAIAAMTIGSNPTRAMGLNGDLVQIWDDFKAILTHKKQSLPVRRRRTRYRV
jgi:hypothetical protein